MPRTKLILICQTGGEFRVDEDRTLSYVGGEAHAVDITPETSFDDLKLQLAELCNFQLSSLSLKYFLPENKKIPITVSSDKDLKRMINFYGDAVTAEIYLTGHPCSSAQSLPPCSDTEAAPSIVPPVESQNAVTCELISSYEQFTPERMNLISTVIALGDDGLMSQGTTIAVSPLEQSSNGKLSLRTKRVASSTMTDVPDTEAIDQVNMNATPDPVKQRRRTSSRKVAVNSENHTSDNVIRKQKVSKALAINNLRSCEEDSTIVDVYVEQELDPTFMTGSYVSSCNDNGIGQDSLNETVASWKDGITGVGQDFSGVAEFRDVLQKYSIAHRFGYRFKKNDTSRASVVCAAEGCSWKMHASWVPAERVLRIKKMNNSHTCAGESWKVAHPSKSWLVSVIKDRLKESPHQKPKDLANGIYKDFGIELNYTQVWRGLEDARVQLQGSHRGAYSQLPWFCEKLEEANPGSTVKLCVDSENKFMRLFLSFHGTVEGFQKGCRPLLFLDSTSLRSKYHEVLLTATALDGNNGLFPVSFAVVDVENDSNWHWFLEQLRLVISSSPSLTFVSDKDKGLRKMILEVFQDAHHGYSIYHLLDSFMFNLKGPYNGDGKCTLLGHLLSAAHANRLESFRMFTEQIKKISLNAYEWVMQSEPEFWSNALFNGEHYDHITVDVAELYADWMEEVRDKPIIQKIEALTHKIMELINSCNVASSEWTTKLTPTMEQKLQEDTQKARHMKVLFSSDSIFEVHDDSVHVVNTESCCCSCLEWEVSGLPCRHSIAVFLSVGKNPYDFCSCYCTVDCYRATYCGSITPVLALSTCTGEGCPETANVAPPSTTRPLPQKEKRHKAGEFRRTVTCTRCKGVGHNKVTCKVPVT